MKIVSVIKYADLQKIYAGGDNSPINPDYEGFVYSDGS